jgi:hypothetical protein
MIPFDLIEGLGEIYCSLRVQSGRKLPPFRRDILYPSSELNPEDRGTVFLCTVGNLPGYIVLYPRTQQVNGKIPVRKLLITIP